jgi:hypothetical protein
VLPCCSIDFADHHAGEKPAIPPPFHSWQVLLRFAVRLVVLSAFASLSTRGFGTTFAALLALSVVFCAMMGALLGEAIFGRVLTHWDEAAAYVVVGHLASVFS